MERRFPPLLASALDRRDKPGHYQDYDRPAEQLLRWLTSGLAYQGEHSRYRGRLRGEPTSGLPTEAFVNFLQNHDQIGNRPDGKRLWMLLPERSWRGRDAAALLPTPILMFMGDEFHAPTCFRFSAISKASSPRQSREGRRREFASSRRAPSRPAAERTRARRARPPCSIGATLDADAHAIALERYRRLLETRREVLAAALAGTRRRRRAHRPRARLRPLAARGRRRLELVAKLGIASCSRRRRARRLLAATEPSLRRAPRAAAVVRRVAAGAISERIPGSARDLPLAAERAFGFAQRAELVPYLARLGISHCYFSPYLKTRPGE